MRREGQGQTCMVHTGCSFCLPEQVHEARVKGQTTIQRRIRAFSGDPHSWGGRHRAHFEHLQGGRAGPPWICLCGDATLGAIMDTSAGGGKGRAVNGHWRLFDPKAPSMATGLHGPDSSFPNEAGEPKPPESPALRPVP